MTQTLRRVNGRGPEAWGYPPMWAPSLLAFLTHLVSIGRARTTIKTQETHLLHLARFVQKPPGDVTDSDISAYFVVIRDNSSETRKGKRNSFKQYFSWYAKNNEGALDPTLELARVRVSRGEPRRCPDDVITTALGDPNVQDWVKLAIRILANSGVRRSECVKIRPVDVTYSSAIPWLYVTGKGGHSRTVPIPDSIADEILRTTTEYVFPATTETGCDHLSPRYFGERISEALPGKWTAHTLRHRYATVAYQHSSDIRSVQALLGHASIATTQLYVGVDRSAMVIAARAAMSVGDF